MTIDLSSLSVTRIREGLESVSADAVQPENRPFSRYLASQVSKIGRASSHSPMVFQ